jgi:predicted 3-demethylubiquinone-9 3-methyltransferase (glyoxalase superfamily)
MSSRPDDGLNARDHRKPEEEPMTSISPCLWFDDNLEEAAEFYTKIFPNSSVGHFARYTEAGPGEPGTAMAGEFDLDGGEESMCGWLRDRFGLSWQIVPDRLYELVSDPDPARAKAATEAMLGMRKIVIADLEAAADRA